MTKAKPLASGRGIIAFGTPAPGEIVSVDGVEGTVARRSQDGAAVWVTFEGKRGERMFTHRAAIGAFREFPERVKQGNLTVGRNGW